MIDQAQKILLIGNVDDEAQNYLSWCCEQSNKLYNLALFSIRQTYFDGCPVKIGFDKENQALSSRWDMMKRRMINRLYKPLTTIDLLLCMPYKLLSLFD